MLRLYVEEVQALSYSVQLPGFLAPLRARAARRLRDAMAAAANTLMR